MTIQAGIKISINRIAQLKEDLEDEKAHLIILETSLEQQQMKIPFRKWMKDYNSDIGPDSLWWKTCQKGWKACAKYIRAECSTPNGLFRDAFWEGELEKILYEAEKD